MTNELFRYKAINLFLIRRQNQKQIDNSSLQAGEPMYFYCKHCGAQADVVEEEYLFNTRDVCSQCEGLESRGWLEEAILKSEQSMRIVSAGETPDETSSDPEGSSNEKAFYQ